VGGTYIIANVIILDIAEIERGLAKSTHPKPLRLFLDSALALYTVLPLDTTSAAIAGKLRAALEQSGNVIGPCDLLIAGVALANNLTPVTRNTGEFERVPGLRMENWYEAY